MINLLCLGYNINAVPHVHYYASVDEAAAATDILDSVGLDWELWIEQVDPPTSVELERRISIGQPSNNVELLNPLCQRCGHGKAIHQHPNNVCEFEGCGCVGFA